MTNGLTLNKSNYNTYMLIVGIMAAVAIFAVIMLDMVFAAGGGTFIGTGANKLMQDFAIIIALAGIAVGIFQIVKGRMVMGIVVLVVAAVIYAFCKSPEMFGNLGKLITGIFM